MEKFSEIPTRYSKFNALIVRGKKKRFVTTSRIGANFGYKYFFIKILSRMTLPHYEQIKMLSNNSANVQLINLKKKTNNRKIGN